jgi:hypothetical protein
MGKGLLPRHAGLVAQRHDLYRETYKSVVKDVLQGCLIEGPHRHLQLESRGKRPQAIDMAGGEMVDPSAFKALIREAVDLIETPKPKK